MAISAPSELDRLVADYLVAWNSHDPARIAAFLAPDALYEDTGAGVTLRGPEGLREHAAGVLRAFPDLRFELVRVASGEGFVAGEWRAEMTHRGELDGFRPSGRRVRSTGVDIATLDDQGRITHLVSHYDGAAIMRQLGLLPARGSRAERLLARLASLRRAGRSP
jgi:steroid delta-isomerase-like uncharacterized protein